MNLLKLPVLATISLLVACGEKEAPAPASKVLQESSVDALLGDAPRPATASPASSVTPPRPAPMPQRAASDIVPRPGEGAYDRNLAWLQKLKSATPVQKQAIKLEIDGSNMTTTEREAFEKMRLHYNVSY